MNIHFESTPGGKAWEVPTIDTLNKIKRARGVPDSLALIVGASDRYSRTGRLLQEAVWRHQGNREIVASLSRYGITMEGRHDIFDHVGNSIELAIRLPNVWIRATDALHAAFVYLDAAYPDLKGRLIFVASSGNTPGIPPEESAELELVALEIRALGQSLENATGSHQWEPRFLDFKSFDLLRQATSLERALSRLQNAKAQNDEG